VSDARFGYFSISRSGTTGDDRDYLEWHQLDHMPEQWRIPGVVWGSRWASTAPCEAVRAVQVGEWAAVAHVVNYLMREPIEETLDDFFSLAQELRDAGRFSVGLPSVFQGALRLLETHAAPRVLVAPDVVPFRPNRGVYVVVEEPTDTDRWDAYQQRVHRQTLPAILAVPGVAGAWVFGTSPSVRPREIYSAGHYRITVCYLDDEPAAVGARLVEPLSQSWEGAPTRPLLAAPFESMMTCAWDRF